MDGDSQQLLEVLKCFESELDSAALEEHAANLIRALKQQQPQPVQPQLDQPLLHLHVEIMDAHRQLRSALEADPTRAILCEALLRILPTAHAQRYIPASTAGEALECCLQSCEKRLEQVANNDNNNNIRAVVRALGLFREVFALYQQDEQQQQPADVDMDVDELAQQRGSLMYRAAGLALSLFSGKIKDEPSLARAWRVALDLFRFCGGVGGGDHQHSLLQELHQVAASKFALDARAQAALPMYAVESVMTVAPPVSSASRSPVAAARSSPSQLQQDLRIDYLSLLAMCLLQCGRGGEFLGPFVGTLMAQCETAGKPARKAERNVAWPNWLRALTRDALIVLRCPEFPLAEPLCLLIASSSSSSSTSNSYHLLGDAQAVDTVAQVLAALERDSLVKDEFLVPAPSPAPNVAGAVVDLDSVVSSESEVCACPCQVSFNTSFLIDCFRCHRWFHGECVGVNSQQHDLHLLAFTCTDCQVYALVESALQEDDNGDGDGNHGGQRSEARLKAQQRAMVARHLRLVAKRNRDVCHALALNSYDAADAAPTATVDDTASSSSSSSAVDTNTGSSSSSSDNLNHTHYLQPLTRNEASKLCRLTANQGATAADGRAKLLASLLKTLKLADAAQMRCHTIKQLGVVLEANPALFAWPLVKLGLGERLQDKSILVREACLDLVARSPCFDDEYRQVVLLSVHDEGLSVRKRAIRLISDIILRQDDDADVSSILVEFSLRLDDFKEEEAVKNSVRTALQQFFTRAAPGKVNLALRRLCQLQQNVGTGGFAWLDASLADATLTERFRACCELAMNELRNTSGNESEQQDRLSWVKLCRVLAAFLSPSELKDLVFYIAPRPTDAMAYEVCEVFALRGESFSGEAGEETLAMLKSNLKQLVVRCGPGTLPSVVKAIAALQQEHVVTLIAELWNLFASFLDPSSSSSSSSPRRVDHCERAILCLSLLVKHGTFPAHYVDRTAALVLPFLAEEHDASLRRYALQAAAWLLVKSDSSRFGTIAASIHPLLTTSNHELRCQALCSMHDILIEADRIKSERDVAMLTSLVVQRLDDYVALMKSADSSEVRMRAVQLVHALLKRQLVHQQQAVAPLVSLLRDAHCHDAVLLVLREAYERSKFGQALVYQGIVDSRGGAAADGEGEEDGVAMLGCFSDAYYLFVGAGTGANNTGAVRTERRAFLTHLVNALFDKSSSLQQVHFLCQVLARLPYQTYHEVLTVVLHVRKRATLLASALRDKLDPVFGPVLKARGGGAAAGESPASQELVAECYTAVSTAFALRLARYLYAQYKLTANAVAQHQADGGGKDDRVLPDALTAHQHVLSGMPLPQVSFPVAASGGGGTLTTTLRALSEQYAHLIRAMKEEDGGAPVSVVGGGQLFASLGGENASPPANNKPQQQQPQRKKRASTKQRSAKDDDDDDDEENAEDDNDDGEYVVAAAAAKAKRGGGGGGGAPKRARAM